MTLPGDNVVAALAACAMTVCTSVAVIEAHTGAMKSKLARKLEAYRDLTITILSYSRWVTRKIYESGAYRRGGSIPFDATNAQSSPKLAWFFSQHPAHRLVHRIGKSRLNVFSGLQKRD
jgi:hypothetical protein